MTRRLFTLALILALTIPLGAGERRRDSDLARLAAELERTLGAGSVEVHRASGADEAILEAMNRERLARGLNPLRINRSLSLAAADRIDDMFARRYFAHVAPDGTAPFVWVTRRGYDFRKAGENLAVGYRGAEGIVDGWMGSPGHRANILNPAYDEVGLAIAEGSPTSGFRGPTVVALYAAAR